MPLSNEPLLPSAVNVLRASGIVQLLKTYPNQHFVDTLTSIAISGAQVGFQGNPLSRTQCPNHSSALIHPEVISKSIQAELRKGQVKEISDLLLNYFCSPIGLVHKQTDGLQTGWRVIFDLSSPQGSSVNDGIPKEYGTFVYETQNDAVRLVVQAGKGAVLMK